MSEDKDRIFILPRAGEIQQVERVDYVTEDDLQKLIEDFPVILESDLIGGDESSRFMLVKREAGIPDAENTGNRWSVDHLLLDQYGIPTFVEVKRRSDTRIRREVIGQLLEYAANAERYWPAGKIRQLAIAQHGDEETLISELGILLRKDDIALDTEDADEFWSTVEENIQQGRIRLLFVADELPREVKRIIEFLNAKMKEVEVLGVELRHYQSGVLKALVPRVIGQTEVTREAKSARKKTPPLLTKEQMLDDCPDELKDVVVKILSRGKEANMTLYMGVRGFSLRAADKSGELQSMFYCYPSGVKDDPGSFIDGYLPAPLRDNPIGDALAESLLIIPGVNKRGQWTYRLELTSDTKENALAILETVINAAKELRQVNRG